MVIKFYINCEKILFQMIRDFPKFINIKTKSVYFLTGFFKGEECLTVCFLLQVHCREGRNPHTFLLTRDGTCKSGTKNQKTGGKVKRDERNCPSQEACGFSVSPLSGYFSTLHLSLYICTMPRYSFFFFLGDNNFFYHKLCRIL